MRKFVVFIIACILTACAVSPGWSAVALDEENFPDATFRGYLADNFDSDGDGVLSNREITSVKEVYTPGLEIKTYQGIKYLTSLEELTTTGKAVLEELDLSGMTSLTYVEVKCWSFRSGNYDVYSGAKKINVSGCTSLQELYCYNGYSIYHHDGIGPLTTLNVNGCSSLQKLYCSNQLLTELDASECTSLHELYCVNDALISLNLSNCTALEDLRCNANSLTKLDLSSCTALQDLNCDDNNLTSLDLSANTNLVKLECRSNQLVRLNLKNSTNLKELYCNNNQFRSLNISKNTSLTTLECRNNKLQNLDTSSNKNLTALMCSHNSLPFLDTATNTNLYSGSDYFSCSPQNIDGLNITRQADNTYAVNLRDYLSSKIKNVDSNSIYAKDDDGKFHDPLSYDSSTGIITFSVPPATVYYEYDTKFGKSDTQRYMGVTIAASGAPLITTNSLPYATTGMLYAMEIEARGEQPISWTLSGQLPEGLAFNSDTGEITGTPTNAGKYIITAKAYNDFGSYERTFLLYVWTGESSPIPAVIITPSVNSAVKGTPYSAKLEAAGDSPITWSVSGLPAGLSFNTLTGEITGTLTSSGEFSFTATASNNAGSDTRTFTLNVKEKEETMIVPMIATDENLGTLAAGETVSITLEASGTKPITWQLSDGTLPAGLTLSDAGIISGIPSESGDYSFTVSAQNNAGEGTKTFTVSIIYLPAITTSEDLGTFKTGDNVSIQLNATGTAPITWAITDGTLPEGITLSETGTISGASSNAGNYSFTVRASNSAGNASRVFTITIAEQVTAPKITTAQNLGTFMTGDSVSLTLEASGTKLITWEISGGTLPEGLTLGNTGMISGTALTAGSYSFTVKASNSGGNDSRTFTLMISERLTAPVITTSEIPVATTGTEYRAEFTASGSETITWSCTGSIPPGLTLSEAGILSGTPSSAGTYTITLTAKNTAGTDAKNFTIIVYSPSGGEVTPPAIATKKLPDAFTDLEYSYQMEATGSPEFTWTCSNLPSGMYMDDNGLISGTPSSAGTYKLSFTASNSGGTSKAKSITLKVKNKNLTITPLTLPSATWSKKYTKTFKVSGMTVQTWAITGDIPDGMTFDTAKGKLTGTPKETGDFDFTITASNGAVEVANDFTDFHVKGVAPKLKGSLKSGKVGTEYYSELKATGTTPITWDIENLPEGLEYEHDETGEKCIIKGTPEEAFNAKINLTLTNGADESITKSLKLKIISVKPKITTKTLNSGTAGQYYSAELEASGSPVITWEFVGGNLPSGLTFEEDGTISGTPDSPGTYKFKARAVNSGGKSSAKQFTLKITAASVSSLPESPVLEEITAAILPAVSVDECGMYEFTVSLDVSVPAGGTLVWHSWPDGEDDPQDSENAFFLDADGEITQTVPEDYSVTISAWLEPGHVYEPEITVRVRRE